MDSNGGWSGSDPVLYALPTNEALDLATLQVKAGPPAEKDTSSLHTVPIDGLPAGFKLNYVRFAPNGGGFAFMGRPAGDPTAHYELWRVR